MFTLKRGMIDLVVLMFLLVLLCQFVSATSHELTSEQKAIQEKLDENKELSIPEFAAATDEQKKKYVLTNRFNPGNLDQAKVFEQLALAPDFNYATHLPLVEEYLFVQSRFGEQQKKIFVKAAEIDVGVINRNPVHVTRYIGDARFFMESGVKFSRVKNGVFHTAGEKSTQFNTQLIGELLSTGTKISVQKDGSLQFSDVSSESLAEIEPFDFIGTITNKDGFGMTCAKCKFTLTDHKGKTVPAVFGENIKLSNGHELKRGIVRLHSPDYVDFAPVDDQPAILKTKNQETVSTTTKMAYVSGLAKPPGANSNYILSDIDPKAGVSRLMIHNSDPGLEIELPHADLYNDIFFNTPETLTLPGGKPLVSPGEAFVYTQDGERKKGVLLTAEGIDLVGGLPQTSVINLVSGHVATEKGVSLCQDNCAKAVHTFAGDVFEANLEQVYRQYKETSDRKYVRKLFGTGLHSPEHLEVLEGLIESSEINDRFAAASALVSMYHHGHEFDERSREVLVKALSDDSLMVRSIAASALDDEQKAHVLFTLYQNPETKKSMRLNMLGRLAQLKHPATQTELENMIGSSPQTVLRSLRHYDNDRAREFALEQLSNPKTRVRHAAVAFFEERGDIEVLKKTLSTEEDRFVKRKLESAIRRLEAKRKPKPSKTPDVIPLGTLFQDNPSQDWATVFSENQVEQSNTMPSGVIQRLEALGDENVDFKDIQILSSYSVDELKDIKKNRAGVESAIQRRIQEVGTTKRGAAEPGYTTESFESQKHRLTIPELLKIRATLQSMRSPELRSHIGELIDVDTHDHLTEHGGYVHLTSERELAFHSIPPRKLQSNHAYLSPGTRPIAGRNGIFGFHLHAADPHYHNEAYAGPSGTAGDLHSSRVDRTDGLVISPLDECRFNLDMNTARGEVIDLGNYNRCNIGKVASN